MKICPLIHYDERVLELTCSRRVETEIGLQRNLDRNTGRNIHKRTAGPDRPVQGCELMIRGRDQLHKMTADHFRVGTVHCALKIRVDDPLLRDLLFHIVIDQLRIILGTDAGQRFTLRLRDPELLEGIADGLRNILPVCSHLRVRPYICHDIFHIESFNIRTPVDHRRSVIDLKGSEPEFPHPFRVILFSRDRLDNVRRKAFVDLPGILILISEIIERTVYVLYVCFFLSHNSPRLPFNL